jgi:putative transposase
MLLQEIKRSSSKWIKNKYPQKQYFAWQNGYAAFSVSQSKLDAVRNYIQNQQEHHTKKSFREELLEFLKSYQVEYKEEYL